MSKWNLEKIKKQIKFGDFVSLRGGDYSKEIFVACKDRFFFTVTKSSEGVQFRGDRDLLSCDFKFYDRQGKEILPEPEYKYVQCESALEVCELIIKGETLCDKRGNRHRGQFTVDYVRDNWKEFIKRVEV